MSNQTAKSDAGKLELTLVPPELIEAVAVVRMYGNMKYPDGGPNNWRGVEIDRYKNALFRHLLEYLRAPYGLDVESGLPALYHAACNIAFLLALEVEAGTIPGAQEALKRMKRPETERRGIYG